MTPRPTERAQTRQPRDELAASHINFKSAIAELRKFPYVRCARLAGLRRADLAIYVALAIAAAAADAAMLALLIPLGRAAGGGSLDTFWRMPLVARLLPNPPDLAATFLWAAGLMFALALIKNGFLYAENVVVGRLRADCAYRLGNRIFDRYLGFGKTWFDRTNVGQMATILDYRNDVVGVLQAFFRVTSIGLILAGYLCVMLLISWRLTLIALVLFPIVNLASRSILSHTAVEARKAKKATVHLGKHVYEVLAMMPLYQSAGRQAEALREFSKSGELLRDSSSRAWRLQGLSIRIQDLTALVALLLMLTITFQAERGSTAQPVILLVFFFIARLSLPMLAVFPETLLEVCERMPRCQELLKIFDDGGKFAVRSGPRQFQGLQHGIRFANLTFAYHDGPPVLRNINFEIEKGHMTALVGPTGAGKSTLSNILMRFYDVSPGTVFLDGVDIRDYSVDSLRRSFATVSQDSMILSGTLRSNLLFGVERPVSDEEMEAVLEDACLADVLSMLPGQLDGVIGEHGATLSGGQRQRVAIARALLRKASVLVLDEATSGLDAITENLVRQAVANAIRHSTALVIAHRFATIQRADHVVVLSEGQVVEQGTVPDLLERRGLFHRMWEHQQFS
jgi:ATP-binding cassette, subfamily B, bacterial MsbA